MRLVATFLFALCLLPLACGLQPKDDEAAQDDKKVKAEKVLVRLAKPKRGKLAARLEITARVEALERANVLPRAAGIVTAIHVEAGEQVNIGDVLAEIENDELLITKKENEVALKQAELAVAQAVLSQQESAAMLRASEIALARDTKEKDRAVVQEQRGALAKKDLEAAEYTFTRSLADKEQTALQFRQSEGEVQQAELALENAKQTLSRTELNLSWRKMRATIQGCIVTRHLRLGEESQYCRTRIQHCRL